MSPSPEILTPDGVAGYERGVAILAVSSVEGAAELAAQLRLLIRSHEALRAEVQASRQGEHGSEGAEHDA